MNVWLRRALGTGICAAGFVIAAATPTFADLSATTTQVTASTVETSVNTSGHRDIDIDIDDEDVKIIDGRLVIEVDDWDDDGVLEELLDLLL